MDQLSAMRVFVRVVETGNFTRAAAALGLPKTSVTSSVQSLEGHLRTTLLNRTTRRVMVTTDGALYYERAIQILQEIDELDSSLSNAQALPSGRLRVEMAGAFADLLVLPALADFHRQYPQIRLDIGVGDRLVDYIVENVDCALRGGTPTDQSLIARKVGEMQMVACVSPDYIALHGQPVVPDDLLGNHQAVGYLTSQSRQIFEMEFRKGDETKSISPNYIVSVNDARSYVNAVLSGLGVGTSPAFMVRDALARGDLIHVFPDWTIDPFPLYIVYPPTRHLSNKVRVFVDWLSKLVQTLPADRVLGKP
jgi:LysR family transcriptional regulator for bpeEF and oprC